MRELVKQGYEKGKYTKTYSRNDTELEPIQSFLLQRLLSRIKKRSRILDLGCGVGLPSDKYLADKNYDVIGIDISEKHIKKAKENVKDATFFVDDFFSDKINKKFDAIISFYAIFHIPRKEHKKLFHHMNSLLKKDGLILITLGTEDMKYDFSKDFVGAPMAWSSYDVEKNKTLLQESGFDILIAAEDYTKEKHLWILAKKR